MFEDDEFQVIEAWEPVSEADVQTPADVYEELKSKLNYSQKISKKESMTLNLFILNTYKLDQILQMYILLKNIKRLVIPLETKSKLHAQKFFARMWQKPKNGFKVKNLLLMNK